jgi:hypothetical protein
VIVQEIDVKEAFVQDVKMVKLGAMMIDVSQIVQIVK